METQAVLDDLGDGRLEPTLLQSDTFVSENPTEPKLVRTSSSATTEEQGHAVADRYLLRSRVGQGRFGEIYEAIDLRLSELRQQDHRVLLERATLSRGETDVRGRLASEFLHLLSVSHPNVARVLDFGVDGATIFFTTEFLEGVSLRAILDSNPTDPATEDELLAIIHGVSDGLSYLHSRGVIHGALTPESVFVTTEYEVKVVDLASTRFARARDGSTEVRFGGSIPLDVRDDVFGVGCVVYEWLTNAPPFGDASPYEAFRTETKPRRIKSLPRYRWKALSSALELQPEVRTSTVAEFASAFGITGTETLRQPAAEDAAKHRRFLRPALWLGAIAGIMALAQANFADLRGLFVALESELEERSGSIASQSSDAPTELGRPVETVDAPETAEPDLYPYAAELAAAPAPVSQPLETGAVDPADGGSSLSGREMSEDGPLTVASAEPVPAPEEDTVVESPPPGDAAITATPLGFGFAEETLTVSEGDRMVAVVVERTGDPGSDAAVIWWTAEGTASPGDDYADLGVKTEPFAAGQESVTVYVPLVSDSLIEQPESFNVLLSWESAPSEVAQTLEVYVVDDDS